MFDAFGACLGSLCIVAGGIAALQGSPMGPAVLAIGVAVLFSAYDKGSTP